jgi:hypothetical protein
MLALHILVMYVIVGFVLNLNGLGLVFLGGERVFSVSLVVALGLAEFIILTKVGVEIIPRRLLRILSCYSVFLVIGYLSSLWYPAVGNLARASLEEGMKCLFLLIVLGQYFNLLYGIGPRTLRIVETVLLGSLLCGAFSVFLFYSFGIEISAILAYRDTGDGGSIEMEIIGRPSGVYGNANGAGLVCCFCLAMLYERIDSVRKLYVWLFCGFSIICCWYCLYLTLSQSCIIIGVVETFIFVGLPYLLRMQSGFRILSGMLRVVLSVGAIFALLAGAGDSALVTDVQINRVRSILALLSFDWSSPYLVSSMRFELFREGLSIAMNSPIFGNGLGLLTVDVVGYQGVHNFYVQLFGEAGFVPVLLFLYALMGYGSQAWRGGKLVSMIPLFCCLIFSLYSFSAHNINISRVGVIFMCYCSYFDVFRSDLIVGKWYGLKDLRA